METCPSSWSCWRSPASPSATVGDTTAWSTDLPATKTTISQDTELGMNGEQAQRSLSTLFSITLSQPSRGQVSTPHTHTQSLAGASAYTSQSPRHLVTLDRDTRTSLNSRGTAGWGIPDHLGATLAQRVLEAAMSSDPWGRVLRSLLCREPRARAALTETLREGVAPQQTPYDRLQAERPGNNSPEVRRAGRKMARACMWLCHESSDLRSPVQERSWPRVWHLVCDHMIALQVMERPCDSQSQ